MTLRNILLLLLTVLTTVTSALAASVGKHTYAASSQLATGTWVKVSLDGTDDGIYQITYDQLSRLGFSQPSQVAVYGFGGHALPEAIDQCTADDLPEVAIYHDTERRRLLFYGQGLIEWSYNTSRGFVHRQNTYDTKAYYFLHQKSDAAPLSLNTDPLSFTSLGGAKGVPVQQYDLHLLHEQDLINIGQSGREKYGESFLTSSSQKFDFAQVDSGTVRVTVNFVACSTAPSTLSASLNGTELGQSTIAQKSNDYAFASETNLDKTLSLDQAAGLSLQLRFTPKAGVTPSLANLNYIRIQAKRNFSKPDNFELFRCAEARTRLLTYDLSATSDTLLQVWDVTTPTSPRRQLLSDDATFTPSATGIREYALVNLASTSFPSVNSEGVVANQDLHALPQTNMVIVTAPAYLEQARQLAQYRAEHDGLHVTIVTPDLIYNEFSSGHQDVTAIRLFLKMFYDRGLNSQPSTLNSQLRYLLLWGDGHFDNRSLDRQHFLPSYETDASLVETSSCVCDDYFGFLDDGEGGTLDTNLRYTIARDGVDIGIGRMPVSTEAQSVNVLQKTLQYSRNAYLGTWKNRLCFLSDDDKEGDTPNCHVQHNDQLVDKLEELGHHEFVTQKIYLPAYKQTKSASGTDYPDAKKEFRETLKQGVLVVNYAGHGNTSAITNENMMTSAEASELSMSHLPLWVTASCDVSRWDENGTSLGECLMLNPNGGAIALISTVRVVYAQQNLLLNTAIIENLFNRFDDGTRYRLGDIIRASKLKLGTDSNKLNFCLLGDPSLTLSYPEQQIQITHINGIPTTSAATTSQDAPDALFSLPTLSQVTVRGHILRTGSTTEVDSTFHGLIYPTFYDAVDSLSADKGFVQGSAPVHRFASRTKKAFSGRSEVREGQFEFSFLVPIDISYRGTQGLANFYACSESSAEASGYFDQYLLTAADEYLLNDTVGPTIRQLFLNEESWQNADVVNSTPYFFAEVHDDSGFNATGNTVGHDIILTIRCTSNPLLASRQHILNNYFTTYTDDATTGNVQYSIPELADGTYEATFRIWDAYNNPTSVTFTFTVQRSVAPEAVVVQAYPCPARVGDSITFRVLHNRPESAQELTLQLFTQTGRKVYEATQSSTAAAKAYALDADHPTQLTTAINADETSHFMGSATLTLDSSHFRAGFYLYRVILTSAGSTELSRSHLLMVNP